ncbi:AtaL-like protein [Streptomyces sp. NPDC049577]|uniref:AtaL-like protein n=1 Tax=Streptomyces sp. NPDC049577 TaxID=3155153 RepID=UPI00341F838A
MLTLSWTRRVNEDNEPGSPQVTREQLWRVLVDKAENPVAYVPAITECRVLERYPDGILREAKRGERLLVQRVTYEPEAGRVVFRHTDATDFAMIADEIGVDSEGRLTLTLSLTLAEETTERVMDKDAYLRALDEDFSATVESMTRSLARKAALL